MSNYEEIRRTIEYRNTIMLIEKECDSMAHFSRRIDRSSSQAAAYAGPRPTKRIGAITRKLIERSFNLPSGWLSSDYHGGQTIPHALHALPDAVDTTKTTESITMAKPKLPVEDPEYGGVKQEVRLIETLEKKLWDRVFSSHIGKTLDTTRDNKTFLKFRAELDEALTVLPCVYGTTANIKLETIAVDYVQAELSKRAPVRRVKLEGEASSSAIGENAKQRMAFTIVSGIFDLVMVPEDKRWTYAVDIERINLASGSYSTQKSMEHLRASLNMPHVSEVLASIEGVTSGLGCPVYAAKVYYLELKDGRILIESTKAEQRAQITNAVTRIESRVANMTCQEVEDHLEDHGMITGVLNLPD